MVILRLQMEHERWILHISEFYERTHLHVHCLTAQWKHSVNAVGTVWELPILCQSVFPLLNTDLKDCTRHADTTWLGLTLLAAFHHYMHKPVSKMLLHLNKTCLNNTLHSQIPIGHECWFSFNQRRRSRGPQWRVHYDDDTNVKCSPVAFCELLTPWVSPVGPEGECRLNSTIPVCGGQRSNRAESPEY